MRVPVGHSDREICIIGLGYVGLTLAVAMAETGFVVRGVERNEHIRNCLREGRAHFMETALDGRLRTQIDRGNFYVYEKLSEVPRTTVYIITVGTPLEAGSKSTNLEPIKSVVEDISDRLEDGDMVILRSTVRVGISRDVVKQRLDKTLKIYDLAFCPERTLEGKALLELRSLPQIIGGVNEASLIRASILFGFITPTVVRVSSLEAAEMIKLVNNTQRDLLFAFANEVAEFCDALGISAPEVIDAGNMGYPRSVMPKPGPVGGPCLEKDPYILAESVEGAGGAANMALLGRRLNETLPLRTAELLARLWTERGYDVSGLKIAIIGLAFKGRPETSDLRGTLAVPLIAAIRERFPDVHLIGYDPAVPHDEIESLGIEAEDQLEDVFQGAHIVVFQNNNPRFELMPLSELGGLMAAGGIIYDYWAQFKIEELNLPTGVSYGGLGAQLHLQENLGMRHLKRA